MKHSMHHGIRSGLIGGGALCGLALLLATSGCGSKDPAPPGSNGGNSGTGGARRGGAGGQSDGSGGSAGGGTGAGGQSAGNGGSTAGDAAPGEANPAGGDYFPFKVGNSWEYDVTETGLAPYKKLHKIVRAELVGGTGKFKDTMAFRVETRKTGGVGQADATVSWQARMGTKVVRYREYSCSAGSVMLDAMMNVMKCTIDVEDHWDPARLRIDEKPQGRDFAVDMPWEEPYTEYKARYSYIANPAMPTITNSMAAQKDTWVVKALGVSETTPAGTFSNCVVLQKTSPTALAKTYTFCRGVGKVKEAGAAQTEILSKFTLM